jgi:flagellin
LRQAQLGLAENDILTAAGAQGILDDIEDAISTVAEKRGDIGAYQNRLGYAAGNLAISVENFQAAESVIRDVDMAAEMSEFTKNQILLQAGTAMLAQANLAPQQVLALFG